jgi:hypothetical protein
MSLTPDSVIWITDKYGVALDQYQDKVKIQGVTKYQKGGEDVLTWDWIHRATFNKDTKQREVPAKANGVSGINLGDKAQAIATLYRLLQSLGHKAEPDKEQIDEDSPF